MHLGRTYKLTLEKIGANDVPISSIARRIEIEIRTMSGETTGLELIEAKNSILF